MDQNLSDVWTHERARLEAPELSVVARSMIAARRALHGPLPSALIPDPALDFLLALFVAGVAAQELEEDELVKQTSVGRSVALRWLKVLQQAGLVGRVGEKFKLSDAGLVAISDTLHAVARSQWHLDESGCDLN